MTSGYTFSSSKMLRPRALAAALNKMNTGGVQSVMLFNQEGVLLAFTSFAGESERLNAAIAANIWNICQRYLEAGETVSRVNDFQFFGAHS